MYLTHSGNMNELVTALAPWYDNPSILVKSKAPRKSPWRVMMIGDAPGDFLESDIIQNLNEACAIKNPSWITPGKSAWDRWWCGDYLPDVDFKIAMNDATMKYFIDFAAEMGWEYQLVDWEWYGEPFHPELGSRFMHPDADITTMIPGVDIPGLVKYAKKKGVKLIIWLEWMAVDRQMDEAFALYEKWGVAGVKIDFMARDDQYMVNFYHRCVQKAAEHRLIVDFHGAYKPTGWSRTWPNVITREGVLGNEYTKWSDRITPDHCLTLPFTRGFLGEMDFTPGGFRQKTKETFRAVGHDGPGPFVMGTRCYQLAMMVVYESALQVICDSPYSYRSSPAGLDFLKIVPTTWDDTKVIHGKVGDYITVARRSGDTWYIGSMTDWTERILDIPLDFLGKGKYKAEIWMDAHEANDYPDRLMKAKKIVSSKDIIKAEMASGGGHVVVLRPVR
jgi:alpha-glucosidase